MNIIRLQGETELRAGIYYEYDIDSKPLGEGGMGRVFKGFRVNQRTGERMPVAIKAIYENIPERVVERARREAEIQVDHDNLIRMYGFVEALTPATEKSPTRVHYHVIMELLIGVTLEDFLNGITTDKFGMQIPYAAELYNQFQNQKVMASIHIMKAVLAGLMSLHDKGIIHRDIDPSNIMITYDNKIKLIDFGICKQIVNLGSQDKGLTATGVFMGKVNYAAPELVLGDVKSQNYTTDIYAMGVLLFQLITGHLPFSGTDQDVLTANLRKKIPLKEIKHSDIKRIIGKATEKTQNKRYGSVAEMRVAIEHVRPDKIEPKFSSKALICIVTVLIIIGLGIYIFNDKVTNNDTSTENLNDTVSIQVIKPSSKQLLNKAIDYMSMDSSDSVINGSVILKSLVTDSAYTPAILEYGILYSKATRAFAELQLRQEKLNIKPDLQISNAWLQKVLDNDPTNYKAAYWIYNNLMTQFEDSSLTPEEQTQLVSTFKLFKHIVENATDQDAVRYKNAMLSAGDEDTLKAWAIIK